ncbi:Fur family transcriptional regulator [Myxococcus faecalis]|uniref:Fur family transcriptional regulator n=2 Tax=Myxococcaceae TaxID=31 RepID=UPI003CF89EE1
MRRASHPSMLGPEGLNRALEHLRAFVRRKGLKSSLVRESVARAALEHVGHFTAEELVRSVRQRGAEDVHPATVYRVLPLLVEAELIHQTLVSGGEGQRYERAFEREHHDHIICSSCGKVVEFHFEAIELLQNDVAKSLGFRLTGHIHELFGVCSACEPLART